MTTETRTIAQQISDRFKNDGMNFAAPILHGETPTDDDEPGMIRLEDVCSALASRERGEESSRWRFADGSSIVYHSFAWDLGLDDAPEDCWCWAGCNHGRHYGDCPHADRD